MLYLYNHIVFSYLQISAVQLYSHSKQRVLLSLDSKPHATCEFSRLVIVIYRKPIYMSGQLPLSPELVLMHVPPDPSNVAASLVDLHLRRHFELMKHPRS